MKLGNPAALALLLSLTSGSAALAGAASGSPALALAALIARCSPELSAADQKTVATLFAGSTRVAGSKKISVTADKVTCRTSNVDLTSRSCEVTYKGGKRAMKGREANELFATMALAGIAAEGAAGSNIAGVTKLKCTLDVGQIKQKDGGGAACDFDAGN